MSWRDNLKIASFRGVPFFVNGSQYQGGRRIQLNEYPLRDLPYAEDLGRKARSYTLDAYVLENEFKAANQKVGKNYKDYFAWRTALIDALEQRGPGTLVHPFLGTLQVVMGVYTVAENFKEGGKAVFSVPFMEAGQLLEPDAATNTQSALQSAATSASTAVQSGFAGKFSAASLPAWINNPTLTKLNALTKTLSGMENTINAVPLAVQSMLQQAASFTGTVGGLIAVPASLAAAAVGMIATVGTLVAEPRQALALYKDGLFGFGETDMPSGDTSMNGTQAAANNQAVNTLVVAAALASYANSASQIPDKSASNSAFSGAPAPTVGSTSPQLGYDSSDFAFSVLNDWLDAVDAVLPNLDDASYGAMLDLRAAFIADIKARAAALPSLVTWTPGDTLPALLAAQILYGDATRADEIAVRNAVQRPGFLPGGTALEVLNA